jgi:penicillin-binding protein 2
MRNKRRTQKEHLTFEEILLDSSNLPSFDVSRMEGRIELPLSHRNLYAVIVLFVLVAAVFSTQLFRLQVLQGAAFAEVSEENRISSDVIVAERGIVYDRTGELVAWNERDASGEHEFPVRAYTNREGLGQLIGYVSYPQKDSSGFYYRTEYLGRTGVEEAYHDALEGENGKRQVEVTARGEIISENVVEASVPGDELHLSIDAELSEAMYKIIATTTTKLGFRSGAGAIIDVRTGEMLAMASFPSYDPELLSDGDDAAAILALNDDPRFPFLNKVIGGTYIPGSIVKPFVAYAALAENIIDPMKTIVSHGSITVPNPYNPSNPSVFNDWRAHGAVTMRDAIAFSSDVYFYTIGGGFGDQKGLGIRKIDEYMTLFGIGEKTGIPLGGEVAGTIPTPEWKERVFDDVWRLGDTYFTSIGQYGFSVTPLEMLRAYAALANGGSLLTPHVILGEAPEEVDLGLNPSDLRVVQEGMRQTVIQDGGTARALQRSDVEIAAKSGTAELDSTDTYLNSWIAGYFPYEEPQYAFILMMERGPYKNTVGAGSVMGQVFDWMAEHRPEYLGQTGSE